MMQIQMFPAFLVIIRSRSYTIPAQKIFNHLAQWENKFYFKNDEVIAQLGFTSNELKEFGEKVFTPGIDMTLTKLLPIIFDGNMISINILK
jgi:hypothetical protein